MRFVWSTAIKDWRRHRHDPLGLILWIGLPLIVGGLLTMVAGGKDGPQPQAHVLVVDEDDSFLSGFLVGAMSQDAMGGVIRAEEVDRESGRARIDRGDASALLIIPKGFGQAVLEEKPMSLQLVTNPAQIILPGIAEEVVSVLVDATFYLHRLIGEDLRELAAGPPEGQSVFSDTRVATLSIKINRIMDRLSGYIFPPVIQLEAVVEDDTDESGGGLNVALLFLPSILFMSLLFMAQGLSMDFWHERDQKTLRRIVVSPQTVFAFLTGKLLAGIGIVTGVSLLAISIGYAYFDLRLATLPLALVWTILSGAFLILLMTSLQVFTQSQRAGGVLSMAITLPLMMVGGSFFPFEAMPAGMAFIGRLTPNGWALEQLKRILLDTVDAQSIALSFVGLLAIGLLLFLLIVRRLRNAFVQD
jgi:ABC-type multidrug transport system permease subunit